MDITIFAEKLDQEIASLSWSFEEHIAEFTLTINTRPVRFQKCSSEFHIKPNEWLRGKHSDSKIHEPGMVAVISLLSKMLDGKVVFYDIGALFGYFSLIADALFDESKCVLVEGNPHSTAAIEQMVKERPNFIVKNVVMGANTLKTKFLVTGFNFQKISNAPIKLPKSLVKNAFKRLLNVLGGRYAISRPEIFELDEITLADLFLNNDPTVTEIIKMDTEGHQAVFLPPFIDDVCKREAIVLMELDSPTKMEAFNASNDEMLQLFLDRGYEGCWLNHRHPNGVSPVVRITKEEDTNALCVLLPKRILNKLSPSFS